MSTSLFKFGIISLYMFEWSKFINLSIDKISIPFYTLFVHKIYGICMNINLKLSGVAEETIDDMIKRGYAATKTEAIRIAILDYKHHHLEGNKMTDDDLKDLEIAMKEYKEGKAVSIEDI